MSGIEEFYVHTATVETFTGAGAFGDTYASPQTIACYADDTRKLVRDSTGEQVVSETTLYTYPQFGGLFTPETKVTLAGGRTALVVKTNTNDSGALGLPDHVAVSLT